MSLGHGEVSIGLSVHKLAPGLNRLLVYSNSFFLYSSGCRGDLQL